MSADRDWNGIDLYDIGHIEVCRPDLLGRRYSIFIGWNRTPEATSRSGRHRNAWTRTQANRIAARARRAKRNAVDISRHERSTVIYLGDIPAGGSVAFNPSTGEVTR